jgi:hypothetical protein
LATVAVLGAGRELISRGALSASLEWATVRLSRTNSESFYLGTQLLARPEGPQPSKDYDLVGHARAGHPTALAEGGQAADYNLLDSLCVKAQRNN